MVAAPPAASSPSLSMATVHASRLASFFSYPSKADALSNASCPAASLASSPSWSVGSMQPGHPSAGSASAQGQQQGTNSTSSSRIPAAAPPQSFMPPHIAMQQLQMQQLQAQQQYYAMQQQYAQAQQQQQYYMPQQQIMPPGSYYPMQAPASVAPASHPSMYSYPGMTMALPVQSHAEHHKYATTVYPRQVPTTLPAPSPPRPPSPTPRSPPPRTRNPTLPLLTLASPPSLPAQHLHQATSGSQARHSSGLTLCTARPLKANHRPASDLSSPLARLPHAALYVAVARAKFHWLLIHSQ